MRRGRLLRNGVTLVEAAELATGLRERLRGLLGRSFLPPGQALILYPCSAVHTFFMRFALDLVFLGRDMTVTRIAWNVPPFRAVFGGWRAVAVIEAQSGWLCGTDLCVGDRLEWADAEGRPDILGFEIE
ncbi:MAG: DUF192 domain-containing protein [Kiritimatiellia bacterium]